VVLALGRCCDLLVHPVDDVPFVPDDGLPSYLDLLGEGSLCHVFVNRGFGKSGHLNHLRQSDEPWGVYLLRHR